MKAPRENPSGEPSGDFENDPLWDLLGKADGPVQVSPFFARNVVREVRRSGANAPASAGFLASLLALSRRWRVLAAAVAAAGLVVLSYSGGVLDENGATGGAGGFATQDTKDLEIIRNLDELFDLQETVWLDSTASAY